MTITFKTNLELHVDILHYLTYHESLQNSNLKDKTKIDGSTLNRHLDFLVQNNLVEKRPINKDKVLYTITELGQTLHNWFRKLNNALKLEVHPPHKKGDDQMGLKMTMKEARRMRQRIELEQDLIKKRQMVLEYEYMLESLET